MYSSIPINNFSTILDDFKLDGMMMRYSKFAPRCYNFCLSLGMTPGKIMPSRAFCSDESQGFPIILLAKQFGTFPFNHGRVGGVVATRRHTAHASHGKDLVIIQASHVGYDPNRKEFGIYRRIQTEDCHYSSNCGKISAVLDWYQDEYAFAGSNIFLEAHQTAGDTYYVTINNLLLNTKREEGLFLSSEKLLAYDEHKAPCLIRALSTSKTYEASPALIKRIAGKWPQSRRKPLGKLLTADLFSFKRRLKAEVESHQHLEQNLVEAMAWIVTAESPALAAAQINTQVEFNRTYLTILKEPVYQGRKLVFISGINIDISPDKEQIFPLTKFVPWAALIQAEDGSHYIMEQPELFEALSQHDSENTEEIDLEKAIKVMQDAKEISISFRK